MTVIESPPLYMFYEATQFIKESSTVNYIINNFLIIFSRHSVASYYFIHPPAPFKNISVVFRFRKLSVFETSVCEWAWVKFQVPYRHLREIKIDLAVE